MSDLNPAQWEFPIAPSISLSLTMPQEDLDTEGGHTLADAAEILASALATLHAKNGAYGDAWRAQGWRGNLARIMSKTSRLRTMLWRTTPARDSVGEPVVDTLQDLINLCVFMTLNRKDENEWGHDNV